MSPAPPGGGLRIFGGGSLCLCVPPPQLLDGRRPTGGKLEVVVRLRDPLGPPQVEARTERWLLLDPPAPVRTLLLPPPCFNLVGGARGGIPLLVNHQNLPPPSPSLQVAVTKPPPAAVPPRDASSG